MRDITPSLLREHALPDPGTGDKRARGSALVIAGSRHVPGAALLAGLGALRAGAGRLQIATCKTNASAIAVAVPEALVLGLQETRGGGIAPGSEALTPILRQADCVLVGSGLEDDEELAELVHSIVKDAARETPIVFDAGVLKHVPAAAASIRSRSARAILTPHAGEMAALTGRDRQDIETNAATIAEDVARQLNAIVALKGACTYVASPGNETACCRVGNVGLATSGSGDVLAGVIAGLVARGADPFVATCWAVFLHGRAGDRLAESIGPLGYLARELLDEIPGIMGSISRHGVRDGDAQACI